MGRVELTPREFLAADGVEDWRAVGQVASTYFRTGSFAASGRLVHAVGELAGIDERRAEVDARPHGVTVRLITITDDYYGLTSEDLALARQISAVARAQGATADPSGVQGLVINVGAASVADVLPFWEAVLDFGRRADVPDEELNDPRQLWPLAYFHQTDAPRSHVNRYTSTFSFRVIGPRRGSKRRSRPAGGWSPTSTRRCGGFWLTPKATRRASPPADRHGVHVRQGPGSAGTVRSSAWMRRRCPATTISRSTGNTGTGFLPSLCPRTFWTRRNVG